MAREIEKTQGRSFTSLLSPANCAVLFIDHQPQMLFGVGSTDRQGLLNNVIALARAAKVFNVPVVLTTIESESFSGYIFPQLSAVLPGRRTIERSNMNAWEDEVFVSEVKRFGRNKLIFSGLWTEVCVCLPVLSALDAGYEVYVCTDACAGTSRIVHDTAVQRMIQAGAVPVTWQQVMLEWQRDWSRKQTYDAVIGIIKECSGAYGLGVEYAYTMVHKQSHVV